MGHYKANLRDLEFNLFEVFGRDQVLGTGPYADVDLDTARAVLEEVRALAKGPLADSFADADRNPPVYDPQAKTVTLPESFKASYRALVDAGWDRLPLGADLAGPGTKGLSLFVVPKFHCNWETGELYERNGVYVTNVEKKMGLKVSTTCEVTFGEKDPAVGWLVGDVHNGIAQMFEVIEMARMMVGTKAIATLSTGYLNALDFAKNRVQGADMTQMTDKTAPRVTITHHPDVRRSLMLQKAYAEGLRAMMLYAAVQQDEVDMAQFEAAQSSGQGASAAVRMNDLLLPLVKGVGSERSYELLGAQSLQTLGGSGFLQDYPTEPHIRDAKIDTLYEGTTAIQGMDLFFRKIVRDQGQALTVLMNEISTFIESEAGNGQLKNERGLLADARADVQAMVEAMVADLTGSVEDVRSLYKVGLNTSRLLMSLGDLVVGWLLLRQADVALAKLTEGASAKDGAFYEGKVIAAKFFAQTRLPLLAAERVVVEGTNLELMDLDEAAF